MNVIEKKLRQVYRKVFPYEHEKVINRQIKNTPTLIKKYFSEESDYKLQIGCQNHPIDGWLNADIVPVIDPIIYMDATKRFPFNDNVFSYVFSEHMIEHISLKEGIFMLKECFRILRPGGVLRVVTPNIKFLVELFSSNKNDVQLRYIASYKRFYNEPDIVNETMVTNVFFKEWGHKFIYDKETLTNILSQAGFNEIKHCKVGESAIAQLNNIEKHGFEIGHDFNQLESLVLEAKKSM